MNVSPVNAVGGVCYIRPAGDDMSDRVQELEELCEQQKVQLDQQRKEIEMLRNEVSEWQRKYEDQARELGNIRQNLVALVDGALQLHNKVDEVRVFCQELGNAPIVAPLNRGKRRMNFSDGLLDQE